MVCAEPLTASMAKPPMSASVALKTSTGNARRRRLLCLVVNLVACLLRVVEEVTASTMRLACNKAVCRQEKASLKKLRTSYERLVRPRRRCVGRAGSVQLARGGRQLAGQRWRMASPDAVGRSEDTEP